MRRGRRRSLSRDLERHSETIWLVVAALAGITMSMILGGALYILIYLFEVGHVPYVVSVGRSVISVIPRNLHIYAALRQTMTEFIGISILLIMACIGVLLMYIAPTKITDQRTANIVFSVGASLLVISLFVIFYVFTELKKWTLL